MKVIDDRNQSLLTTFRTAGKQRNWAKKKQLGVSSPLHQEFVGGTDNLAAKVN